MHRFIASALPPALRHLPGPGRIDMQPDTSGEMRSHDIGDHTAQQFNAAIDALPHLHGQQVADILASAPMWGAHHRRGF